MNDHRPAPLETARDTLMERWRAARRRRQDSDLDSPAYREAAEEVAQIEVEIARVERAMDPPRG